MDFIDLTTSTQLNEVDSNSFKGKGVLIFKHSYRCIISRMVWKSLTADWSSDLDDLPVYFLDLISYRSLSQEVAERYNVHHESPQALLIKAGKCVYSESHQGIQHKEIQSLVNA